MRAASRVARVEGQKVRRGGARRPQPGVVARGTRAVDPSWVSPRALGGARGGGTRAPRRISLRRHSAEEVSVSVSEVDERELGSAAETGSDGRVDGGNVARGADDGGRQHEASDLPTAARIVQFVVPALATVLSAPLLSLTDTAFVGRCASSAEASSVSLAALSQATVLADYVPLLATFTATAALNLTAQRLAKKDEEGAVGVASCAIHMASAIGAFIALVISGLAGRILSAQGVRGGVLREAVVYCKWRGLGVPFSSVTAAACGLLAARKDTVLPLIGVLAAGAVNVILDWVLVGVMSKGVGGAAVATSISQIVCAGVVTVTIFRRGYVRTPDDTGAWRRHAKSICGFALPVIFVTVSVLSIFTALILVSSKMGVTTSAAHQILGALFALTSLCGDPLMQAVQAFLPVHLIAGDVSAAGRFLLAMFGIALMFSFVAGSASLGIAYFMPSLFTTSASTIAEIRSALPFFSVAVLQVIPTKVLYGTALAANQLGFLTALVSTGTLVFMLQLWMLMRSGLGYGSLWLVLSSYYSIAILTISFRLSVLRRGYQSEKGSTA